ncbi:nucleoside hydrolase-like [Cydia splendana]|uniref:nucleoside hydrolase-like n=1 Tax=Cydia splendana TaxID=1100963 RepID=UPI00300CF686
MQCDPFSAQAIGETKLVIDHDGGADDAIAIFEALLYEQYFNGPQVLAITTTHGNVPEDQAFVNTQRILNVAKRRDVPIYRGSKNALTIDVPSDDFFGTDGLGDLPPRRIRPLPARPGHAALALIELTKKYPGEVKVVAVGSFTNIALAIRLDPTFLSRVKTLYLADGREASTPKFNVEQDVEAYYAVAKAATPGKVTIVYYRSQINITTEWRRNVLGSLPTVKIRALNTFERISLNSAEQAQFWYPLDPLVVATALNEDLVTEIQYANNSVVLCGDQRGVLINNFTSEEKANVRVFHEINSRKYQTYLYSVFAAEVK